MPRIPHDNVSPVRLKLYSTVPRLRLTIYLLREASLALKSLECKTLGLLTWVGDRGTLPLLFFLCTPVPLLLWTVCIWLLILGASERIGRTTATDLFLDLLFSTFTGGRFTTTELFFDVFFFFFFTTTAFSSLDSAKEVLYHDSWHFAYKKYIMM